MSSQYHLSWFLIAPVPAVGILRVARLLLLLAADAHHFLECQFVIQKVELADIALVRRVLENEVLWVVFDAVVDVLEVKLALLVHPVDFLDDR